MNNDKLHPDIIAFWERKGYTIRQFHSDDSPYQLWRIYNGFSLKYTAAITYGDKNIQTKYFINNKSYSEQEMLKLIKLEAFW